MKKFNFRGFTKATFIALLLSCCVGLASAAGGYMTTFGSRGTVTPTATMYGAFTLVNSSTIYIAVRGPSLWTLGATLTPLDLPNLRVLDAYGNDLLTNANGGNFISGCPSTGSSPGVYVASYYYYVRGEPLDERDTCTYEYLSAGVYTFMITPNSTFESGEVLFEVTVNPDAF